VIVVSDTSPLTNLASIGRLGLLHELYGRLLIPESVAGEIEAGEQQDLYAPFLSTTPWVEVHEVKDRSQVNELLRDLDLGEAEAIVLCLEKGANLLLVDERLGRNIATNKGIKAVGILGSLVACKKKNLIPRIKPILDELMDKAGFWIHKSLLEEVLRAAGES
jgi:uncharacterized protein